ncbi:chromosome segregation protein SMC [Fructilactobacillus ixorae]|uniref:Chromosome partition protein Smc n=1 Tax=Fructilactobacillus ixorae TaxID=1750535 RepID=A0ABY5C8H7_9LACO|nr:chromosome segregation protein SMC [Fructilactobacillus ixorae]USS93888.1 chromosome segregation protein SMC [Fructilactobacillus ixorae]
MKLQSIQISGFKSFADRTVIECQDGLTGIVGPNGSGKSNVIEAIRWALGEQSAKQLRGHKMKDVIFSGSNDRRPLNRAEVSLVFDNADHYLPTDYSEVKITRRYYRNGDSTYLLNDQECLLREIQQLFLDTGLGEGSLSIISQGNVDDILAGDVEKRRAVIETAAGVYRYKKQKAESEKKLTETQANVDRVSDIAHELGKQLAPLQAQSETASRYLRQQQRLEQLRFTQLTRRAAHLQQTHQATQTQVTEQTTKHRQLTEQLAQLREQKQTLHRQLTTTQQAREQQQQQLLTDTKTLESATGEAKLRQQQLDFKRTQLQELERQRTDNQTQLQQLEQRVQTAQATVQTTTDQLNQLEQEIADSDATAKLKQVESEEAALEAARSQYVTLMQQLTNQKNEVRMASRMSEQQRQAYQEKLRQQRQLATEQQRLEQALQAAQEQLTALKHQANAAQARQQRLQAQVDELANQQDQLQQAWYQQLRDFQTVKTERDSLQNMVAGHNNLYRGTRNLLKHQQDLTGVLGPVADLMQVDDQYLVAIETTLGGALQQVVMQTVAATRQAIHYLSQHQLGRVTFLPLDAINERFVSPSLLQVAREQPGLVGVAADLVTMPQNLTRVKNYLLGNVLVTTNLQQATQLSQKLRRRVKIVTLNGEVVNAGGSITGGKNQHEPNGILRQKHQLATLTSQAQTLQTKLKQQEAQLAVVKETGQAAQAKRDEAYQQESSHTAELKAQAERVSSLSAALTKQKREVAALELQLKHADDEADHPAATTPQQIQATEAEIAENQARVRELKQAIQQHKADQQRSQATLMAQQQRLSQIRERLKQARQQVQTETAQRDKATTAGTQLAKQVTQLQQELKQLQTVTEVDPEQLQARIKRQQRALAESKQQALELQAADEANERDLTATQQALTTVQQDLQQAQLQASLQAQETAKLQRELGDLQTQSQQSLQVVDLDPEALEQELQTVQATITELGPVNVGAITAYEELKNRADFVNGQLDDLLAAKQQLLEIMNQMDQTVKQRFQQTFDQVATAFTAVFRHIFGGGEAKLKLADPHHLLTTGIDILVKPPGKRYRDLSLLSGGEKALTALALLFAILQVKPVPFVILDEAESALDPANVDRFARYMQKLKQHTQFIVITHRKETMIYADQLVGITMQDSGVSKLVSVNLEATQKKEK